MRTTTYAAAATLLATAASAGEAPKAGEDLVIVDYVVTAVTPLGREHRDDPLRLRVEFSGVSHEQGGGRLFDRLGVRCAGVSELGGDHGECTATDAEGDGLGLAYASPAPGGRLGSSRVTVIGGSGKFAGLSGVADGDAAPVSATPGLPLFSVRERLVWTFAPRRAEVAATRAAR